MPAHTAVQTLVLIDGVSTLPAAYRYGVRVVRTPLDLVQALQEPFDRVVVVGTFAREDAFAVFIRETCPWIEVVVGCDRAQNDKTWEPLAFAEAS